jgi:hypothetical protein
MKREETENLYGILDSVFQAVNAKNKMQGTGLSFSYTIKPRLIKDEEEDKTIYDLTMTIREMGHGERDLQTLSFEKPKDVDRYTMEGQMIMQFFVAVAETSFIHWNELGKMLNSDTDMQKLALGK